MRRINYAQRGIIAFLLVIAFLCTTSCSSKKSLPLKSADSGVSALIKKRITEWKPSLETVLGGERIYAPVLVKNFYKARNYQPAWSQNGHLIQAETLIRAVEEAYSDGLMPDYYHLNLIRSLVANVEKESFPDQERLSDLDVLLTDAFVTLGCHLSGGCVDPVTIKAEWFAKRGNVDVTSLLEQALKKRQIRETLMRLRPEQASYDRLRESLALYRGLLLNGKWSQISKGPLLKKDSVSDRVVKLRERLAASGDMDVNEAKGSSLFDDKLKQSVIRFQKRHGLMADGIVGSATLNALNIPLKDRIRQIELNMERLRWILGNDEQRSIVINVANFELYVVENGKSVLSMKVVVGKPYWHTPVFTAKMTYLVINPSWNVPDSIAREEMLKAVKKAPHYLAKQNIKVIKGWGSREEEIDYQTIDWSKITAETLVYRFRQEPGPLNPLGYLKFMLPNKFNVYLHDTPAKNLFSENIRTFSHGCTRIEKPLELAEYVLRDDPRWTQEKLLAAIKNGTGQEVRIPHPLNVHFLYLTAWVDERGTLQFRDDIYGRDELLDKALHEKPSLQ
jgi:murein L,D-transpeptidase YcbB/YkuD